MVDPRAPPATPLGAASNYVLSHPSCTHPSDRHKLEEVELDPRHTSIPKPYSHDGKSFQDDPQCPPLAPTDEGLSSIYCMSCPGVAPAGSGSLTKYHTPVVGKDSDSPKLFLKGQARQIDIELVAEAELY
jgi:hypothetical protein